MNGLAAYAYVVQHGQPLSLVDVLAGLSYVFLCHAVVIGFLYFSARFDREVRRH